MKEFALKDPCTGNDRQNILWKTICTFKVTLLRDHPSVERSPHLRPDLFFVCCLSFKTQFFKRPNRWELTTILLLKREFCKTVKDLGERLCVIYDHACCITQVTVSSPVPSTIIKMFIQCLQAVIYWGKKNLKQSWLPAFWKQIRNTQEIKRTLFN